MLFNLSGVTLLAYAPDESIFSGFAILAILAGVSLSARNYES